MHAGLVSVSDGKSKPQPMKLILTSDSLVLQKEQSVLGSCKNAEINSPDGRVGKIFKECSFEILYFIKINDVF